MNETSPIWLLGAPFSGSAWVAGCLHQHPQLYALPQLDLLLADTIGDALKVFELGQGTHGQGLRRAVAWLMYQRQDDQGIRLANAWLAERAEWSCKQLIELFAQSVAPRRLVIPDDDAALRPVAYLRIQAISPQPQILHLTRHPWSQGVLLHQWSREHVFIPLDYKDHSFIPPQVEPQLPWFAANQNLLNWRAQWPATQSAQLRSEDFENHSHEAAVRLCQWLDIQNDPAVLEAMRDPRDWVFAQPGPTLAPAGLDAEAQARFSDRTLALAEQQRLDAALPWRADGQGFADATLALADTLGYAQRV